MNLAARISSKGNRYRRAYVGAVGIRSDGATVTSYNGCVGYQKPELHAEARLTKKLDFGAVVYVARIRRDNGSLCLARPCPDCFLILKHHKVRRVIYSISDWCFGTIDFW